MSEQNNQNNGGGDSSSIMELLTDSLSESLSRREKAKAPVPDVYKSGMRGSEKPPHLREKEKKQDADKKAAKREVNFSARPRVSQKDQIADLTKQLADLQKKIGEGKDGKGKKKVKVTIA